MAAEAAEDPCQKAVSGEAGSAAAQEKNKKHEQEPAPEHSAEPALPSLSDYEFKQYNRLADHMDYFVSLFFIIYVYLYINS